MPSATLLLSLLLVCLAITTAAAATPSDNAEGTSQQAAAAAAVPPASWQPRIANNDMLWTAGSDLLHAHRPIMGNGFVATLMMSDNVHVSGVFNGVQYQEKGKTYTHRARIPSSAVSFAVLPPGLPSDAAIDMREATFYRRSYLDPASPAGSCTEHSTESCTTHPTRVWVEQRWYAHRAVPSLLVMEVEVLDDNDDDGADDADNKTLDESEGEGEVGKGDGDDDDGSDSAADALPVAYLKLAQLPSLPTEDFEFTRISPSNLPPLTSGIFGYTRLAETPDTDLMAVGVLAANLFSNETASGLWPVKNLRETTAFVSVVRSTIETKAEDIVSALNADYAKAQEMADAGTLHTTHVSFDGV